MTSFAHWGAKRADVRAHLSMESSAVTARPQTAIGW
jgi:hypothetical protein